MSGWLSRGLIAVAVGAILAFAVTVRVEEFDIQNAGAIIMFAGLGYLLVHLALLGWEQGWGSGPHPRHEPHEPGRTDTRRGTPYRPDHHAGPDDPAYRPRPAVVEYRTPATHRRDDPDDTQVLPVIRDHDEAGDDTTAIDMRRRGDTHGYGR